MSRCLRLGSSSLAVLSRLGPCLDRLLSLIADCDLTILSCSRLSFCRGNPEDPHGQKFPFLTQIVVQYLNFIDQLKRVVGSIACWCCSAGLLMNATSKIDWFSSVRADFLCTNFQAKCSGERRRRPSRLGGATFWTWDMGKKETVAHCGRRWSFDGGVWMKILRGSVAYNEIYLTTRDVRFRWWLGSHCPIC